MEEKHRTLLDEMLPLLEVIGEVHPDEFIQEMASDIRIAIATRGAVWSSLQENKRGESKSSRNKVSFCALLCVVSFVTAIASVTVIYFYALLFLFLYY